MTRRELLRAIALGTIGHTLDIDKLLWIPGKKTIFLPSIIIESDFTAIEYEAISNHLDLYFDRDAFFYKEIKKLRQDMYEYKWDKIEFNSDSRRKV